ncbi:MAG: tetratricopeptide repeat protein [Cytophagales bacterium]|nr:tetratricopeptide repeat protein [Cytophagales bacterium]
MRFQVGTELRIVLFKYLLIFFFLGEASQSAISQVNFDSLEQVIPSLKGRERLKALEKLAYAYSFKDNNKYFKYARDGIEYSLSDGDSLYLSRFLIELGYHYKYKGAYQEALNNFNRSILISTENGYSYLLGTAYTGLGTVYHELNLYDKALHYHTESLKIKEKDGDKRALAVSNNNIGLIYYKIDDPLRALEYYHKSVMFNLEVGDTAGCIVNYINMGLSYTELQDASGNENAKRSFKKAIDLALKYDRPYRIGYAYNGLASVYSEQMVYDSAKYYLNISIDESLKHNYKKLESSNYYLFAKIAFQEKKYDLAIDYLSKSQELLAKLKDKNRIKNNYRLYSEIFEARNMLDSAFYYQKKYSIMKDSIFNEELANNLTSIQISAATSQKDLIISSKDETISRSKLFSLFLLSILALSIALIVVIFRNYTNTSKINLQLSESKRKIEAQKENLEKKNGQLAEAQQTIQKQNDVLKNINIDLDKKVKERTRELDKSNHELEKAVKDLDQFIYKTSHDLRGPIATMQGIINLGVLDSKDEKSKEYFNTLHNVSNNLNNVLYRLIEVHETYQKKPILEYLDPMKEIMETTNRVSQFSIETDITIITELQANGQWNSDKVLFNLIIENMLRSAMLYKDRGESIIKIKTEYRGKKLNIVFEDNGFGIQPGDEDKVFNIFFKGSPRPGGTGLEVYTAKIAVEKLGGEIKLIKPLKNTLYEINLPVINTAQSDD